MAAETGLPGRHAGPGLAGRGLACRRCGRHFVDHTLAIAELAVTVIEATRQHSCSDFELIEIQTEPASWQTSLSRYGTAQTLKPDLRLVTASGDYERHWFLECDMASEHLPVIVRQCLAYQAHRATGRYEAAHGLYPAVAWVVPTEHRATAIRRAITAEKQLDGGLFTVATPEQVIDLLRAGAENYPTPHAAQDNQPGGQKGGHPS